MVDDAKLMKSWLLDEDPVHVQAALYMFDNLEIADKEPLYHELRTRLIAIGRRPDLPGGIVYSLAAFYGHFLAENPNDPEIRPLAERWEKHSDYVAAGQMSKILLEHTDWRPAKHR